MLKYLMSRYFRCISLQIKRQCYKVDGEKNCAPLNWFSAFNARQPFFCLQQQKHRNIRQHNKRFQHNLRSEKKAKPTLIFQYAKNSEIRIVGLLSLGTAIYIATEYLAYGSMNKKKLIDDIVQKAGPAVVSLQKERSNGIILTNAHVVANKSTVSVKLQDVRVMEGQVTAVDPISDLAIVKVNANNLPTIPLAASSIIPPDELVVAMGSPLSLSYAGTCGIDSSVQEICRDKGLLNEEFDYIGTDVIVNNGEAIGINTMKDFHGISFAIPSDYAIKFLMKAEEDMKNETSIPRLLGITMLKMTEDWINNIKQEVNKYIQEMKKCNKKIILFQGFDKGIYVHKVITGTPAHIGVILAGDIIIDISDTPIKSAADVYGAVEKSDFLKVTLFRLGEKKVIPIDTKQSF